MAYNYKRKGGKKAYKSYKKKARGANDKSVTIWSDHNVLEKANRALQIASQIKRYVNVEVKRHDRVVGPVNVTNAGILNNLTIIPQGDTAVQRDGISVKLMNLTIRGSLHCSSLQDASQARVIVFRGKQENGVGYGASDILETTTVYSPKNYTERFRSKILYDERFMLNNPDGGTQQVKQFNINVKLGGHVRYSEGSNDIEDGGVYVLYISDQATNLPIINYYSRITFTDN